MGWAAAAAAGIQIIGGVIANNAAQGDRDASKRAAQQAFEAINQLQIPDIEKQKLMLEVPQVMGQYFPEEEVQHVLANSQMEGVSTDPRLAQAQMNALESMSKIGETGLTAEDKMNLNKLRRDSGAQEQSRQAGILQNLASRGVSGSGIELAARMNSSQAAAQRQSEESDRLAAMAQNRSLQAIASAGQLGGQIRGQEFNEKSDIAKAQDAISAFNTQNGQQVAQRNVNARNQAQQKNLEEKQRIADATVGLHNSQQEHNKQLEQTDFENRAKKAAMISNAYNGQASNFANSASATAGSTKDIAAGVGGIVGSMGTKEPSTQDKYYDYLLKKEQNKSEPLVYNPDDYDPNRRVV